MITIGCAAYAAGVFLFLDPNALASGGISGVSIILSHLIGIFPTGTWIIILNVPLLIIATWKFGFKFLFTTIRHNNVFPLYEPGCGIYRRRH